mmetsp:Transcript_19381/g.58994  ORF Transcript_19381/g.58994 Transcript_19381/m.58994 type:complete len:205 (-) Transcript_19381:622-1236(-)
MEVDDEGVASRPLEDVPLDERSPHLVGRDKHPLVEALHREGRAALLQLDESHRREGASAEHANHLQVVEANLAVRGCGRGRLGHLHRRRHPLPRKVPRRFRDGSEKVPPARQTRPGRGKRAGSRRPQSAARGLQALCGRPPPRPCTRASTSGSRPQRWRLCPPPPRALRQPRGASRGRRRWHRSCAEPPRATTQTPPAARCGRW